MPRGATDLTGWTWRRVPGRLAGALCVSALVGAACFAGHVSGWGLLARAEPGLVGSALAAASIFGLPLTFLIGSPLLRAVARGGVLARRAFVATGAALYGGLVFGWMALIPVGPPEPVAAVAGIDPAAPPAWWWGAVVAYRHVLTPLVFAAYGGAAAWVGWSLAFGGVRSVAVPTRA